jgi:hypothetical protein
MEKAEEKGYDEPVVESNTSVERSVAFIMKKYWWIDRSKTRAARFWVTGCSMK